MFKRLGIVGAGTMGASIAQLAALMNVEVLLYDINDTILRLALDRIKTDLRRRVQHGTLTAEQSSETLSRLHSRTSVSELSHCDFVLEAIVEDLRVKRDLFKHLDVHTKSTAVLATTSASLPVTAIAGLARYQERIVGMHFFNPVSGSKLVEIARGHKTGDPAVQTASEFALFLEKQPIVVKDTPGFVVNRTVHPFFSESLQIVEEGVAEPQQVDRIMKALGGYPVGPFEAMDADGTDAHLDAAKGLFAQFFGEPRFRPHPLQERMVEAGLLGKKTGRGFLAYDENTNDK